MDSAVRSSQQESKMSKLQTVQIKMSGESFDIVERSTGYIVRADIGRYETAIEIALQIDARNIECGDEYLGMDQ